jgi:hypothetical protein
MDPRRNTPTFPKAWIASHAALKNTTRALLAIGILLAVGGTASAETRTLAWNPATTYTDGTPITGKTVTYSAYWTTNPDVQAPMTPIATGVTQTSASFDPALQKMVPGGTVYFRVKTALNTGEESDYSAALAWVVPGMLLGSPENMTISGLPLPSPGSWRIAWDPVTKYADGQELPSGRTVRYDVYWTRDPALAGDALVPLASSITVPSADFAPQSEGMENNERVYFTVMASLDTGEESAFSGGLAWRVSNKGPGPPARGKIVKRK